MRAQAVRFLLDSAISIFSHSETFFSPPEVITDQKYSGISTDDTSLFDQRADSLTPDLTLRINLQLANMYK